MDTESRYTTAVLTIPEDGTESNIIDVSAYRTMSYVNNSATLVEGTEIYAACSVDGETWGYADQIHGGTDSDLMTVTLGAYAFLKLGSFDAQGDPLVQTTEQVTVVGLKS